MPNAQTLSLPITTGTPSNGSFSGNTGFFTVYPDITDLEVGLTLTPPSGYDFYPGTPNIQVTAQDQLPGSRNYTCSVNPFIQKNFTPTIVTFTATVKPPANSPPSLPSPMQVTITLTYGGVGGE